MRRVYSFSASVDIDAPVPRVWRALCDPAEVLRWDASLAAAVDPPPDYPRPGQHVRWRLRAGLFRSLHDRPQEVVEEHKLRSLLALGPYRYDETYLVEPLPAGGTRLTAVLDASALLPLVGGLVEGLRLGPETRAAFEASLAAIKALCESEPAGDQMSRQV
jgi:hypothetical protein